MRTTAATLLALALAAPAAAAEESSGQASKPAPAHPAPQAAPGAAAQPAQGATPAPARPAPQGAPATAAQPAQGPTQAARPAPPRGAVPARPLPPPYPGYYPGWAWWDPGALWWGWGWGYYPLYPRPPVPPPPEHVERVATTFAARAGGGRDGNIGGLDLGVEGRRFGFRAGVDGISAKGSFPGTVDSARTHGYGTMHLTSLLVSTAVARVRAEIGGSMLSYPETGPDAGVTSFGPNIGISGSLGLVGPVGVEGWVRYTPLPIPISDVQAGLALRLGPAGVTLGWRDFRVEPNTEASHFKYRGPVAQLAFLF
jgi:hypothetical protein